MRQVPFTIRTLPWSQYDALQLDGAIPLPMNVASDSLWHQSRNSLPELIGMSSWDVAIADDATNVSASAIEYLTIDSSLRGLVFARCDKRRT
jgi:hypothetical protein